jgi:hypothetical protein
MQFMSSRQKENFACWPKGKTCIQAKGQKLHTGVMAKSALG